MTDTYTTIGRNLYEFMDALDISAVLAEPQTTWGVKLNRLPKSDEINVYPAFAVTPARDLPPDTGDNVTDFDAIAYSVFVVVSAHGGDAAETQLRTLEDLVRSAFRQFRQDPLPLHPRAYNASFSGEWGGNADQGERWYRIDITTQVYETLDTDTP
jgi:hypothetical protein